MEFTVAVVTRRGVIYFTHFHRFQALIIFLDHVTSAYAKYRCTRYALRILVIVGDHFDVFVEVRA